MEARSFREQSWKWFTRTRKCGLDGCWEWTGGTSSKGYGRIKYGGRMEQAHRVAWETHVGPIPPGMWVLHKCDNRRCVRPDHLFLGTHADNMRDRNQKGRTARGGRTGARLHPDCVARGERTGNARLTSDQVREIRALHAAGNITHKILAARFCVSRRSISAVVTKLAWKHIE
jgi:hypothetical protein